MIASQCSLMYKSTLESQFLNTCWSFSLIYILIVFVLNKYLIYKDTNFKPIFQRSYFNICLFVTTLHFEFIVTVYS